MCLPRLTRCGVLPVLLFCAQRVPAAVSDLTVSQALRADGALVRATDAITVGFALNEAAPVTVAVYADRPWGIGERWYAHPANLVAEIRFQGVRGPQQRSMTSAEFRAPTTPAPMAARPQRKGQGKSTVPASPSPLLPGTYVVEVDDGGTLQHVTLLVRQPGDVVPVVRRVPSFLGASRDRAGNWLVADRGAWRGRRYSPDWQLEQTFPKASMGHSSDPVECFDAVTDARDRLYLATVNGVYRFGPDGNPAPWEAADDYLKCPYPSEVRNLLGVRLDTAAMGKKRYVFGPGGGGAGSKDYEAAAVIGTPGFGFRWGAVAVDAQGTVFVARAAPNPEIQVFDETGHFLRRLPLPPATETLAMRCGSDGVLWLATGRLLRLNATTGAVEPTLNVFARGLHLAPDGALFAWDGPRLARLRPSGDPWPFTASGMGSADKTGSLDLSPARHHVPPETPGFTERINGVAVTAAGDFYVSAPNDQLLHFDASGAFLPERVQLSVQTQQTGNVFVGDAPAAVDVQLANLRDAAVTARLRLTLRDLDGREIGRAEAQRQVAPLTSASVPLALVPGPAPLGYYVIEVEAAVEGQSVGRTRLYGGRVRPRGNSFAPYSAFGSVRMEGNPELVRRAGGGLNRNHNPVYWNDVEPTPGKWQLQAPDALGFFAARAMPAMVILGYGEPWHNAGFPACRLYRYDDYFSYLATVIGQYRGTARLWQFWNEPNFFWHVPGPYQYEQYVMALQATYAICKALDPAADVICDGFAGDAGWMERMAQMGGAGFTDGVPVHYPGARTLAFDNMPLDGTVESKADMIRQLADIRDRWHPGRELFNTEEGLWGKAGRTAEDGAALLPRIYVSQIAAGLDRLTWFECFIDSDPTYLLRSPQGGPWPAYFAYAAASDVLENAQYVGTLVDGLAQVHLFAVAGKPVLVAWSVEGGRLVTLDVKRPTVRVVDWQGNAAEVSAANGALELSLGPRVQYVLDAAPEILAPAVAQRRAEFDRNAAFRQALAALERGDAAAGHDLNTLFHACRMAELVALRPGGETRWAWRAESALAGLEKALKARETDGAYLRQGHTALASVRRLAYFMRLADAAGNRNYARRLAPYVMGAAKTAARMAAAEPLWYPGVMVRVALDATPLRQEAPPDQPLDEKLAPQVTKKPGETVELEMTVYNWTTAPITGTVRPVLPSQWSAADKSFAYTVAPRQFARFATKVTVPVGVAPGIYELGAVTDVRGTAQRELHAHRVEIRP